MRKFFALFIILFGSVYLLHGQNLPTTATGPAAATYKKNLPAYNLKRSQNYQRAYTALIPIQDTATLNMTVSYPTAAISTQYFDQLGRPLQSISKKASPAGKDLVAAIVFDEFGRIPVQYMPYIAQTGNTNDGLYKASPLTDDSAFYKSLFPSESVIYSEQVYDASPLGKVTNQYAPGNSWGGAHKGITITRRANTLYDSVRLWQININNEDDTAYSNGYCQDGTLSVTEITDEKGNLSVVYADQFGRKILTKIKLATRVFSSMNGWLLTYYVYDEMNHMRMIIPPKAVDAIRGGNNWNLVANSTVNYNLCYAYFYDNRDRVVMKRIPGKGKTYFAYDLLDRLVMTQDENLRNASNQWSFIKYDGQNRPVKSGLITTSLTKDQVITNAAVASDYPVLTGTYTIWIETYYDNYTWTNVSTPDSSLVTTNINSTNFITTYNTSPDYAQLVTKTSRIRGMVTGSKTLILGSTTYLYSLALYDENGAIVQTKQSNYTGGTDIATTQYSFSGTVLRTHLNHTKSGTGPQTHTLLTKYIYDNANRLTSLVKNIDGLGDKTISALSYNELGQVQTKTLGSSLSIQNYTYNIRGWLSSINKAYVESGTGTNPFFGEVIAYDFGFTNNQLNGNIAGVKWKGASDGIARAYGFTYDNTNRLTDADFSQQNNGSTSWTSDSVDFSTQDITYDANGNITNLWQKGLQINKPVVIDSLTYTYFSNSNQLSKIKDSVSATDPWGDFKDTTLTTDDYVYDKNGNIVKDNNKHIHTSGGANGITYNFLDKPDNITVNGKGTITYTYDATGSLLQKTIIDTKKNTKTVITYAAGFVYQKVLPSSGNASVVPDTMQYVLHEEGRIRYAKQVDLQTDAVSFAMAFDYFLKDHLNNIRSTITDEQRTDAYPLATLEDTTNHERLYYTNLTLGRIDTTFVAGYPRDPATTPNRWVQKLNPTGNGPRVGMGILLKVMAGDKITVRASSWYSGTQSSGTAADPIAEIIAALQGSIPGASADKFLSSQLGGSALNPSIDKFIKSRDSSLNGTRPRAWLNIVLLDEQLNIVRTWDGKNSVFEQVGAGNQLNVLGNATATNREMSKSGYVYIFVSNETPNVSVYFDNLQVTHVRGKLMQEQSYYPFGLEMKGITSQAGVIAQNNYKFNEGTRLEENFDVDYYETYFRNYDPQTSRFSGVDLLAERTPDLSPYSFGANDPIYWNDPWGLSLSKPIEEYYTGSVTPTNDVIVSASIKRPKYNLPRLGGLSMEDGVNPSFFPLESGGGGGSGISGEKWHPLTKKIFVDYILAHVQNMPMEKENYMGKVFENTFHQFAITNFNPNPRGENYQPNSQKMCDDNNENCTVPDGRSTLFLHDRTGKIIERLPNNVWWEVTKSTKISLSNRKGVQLNRMASHLAREFPYTFPVPMSAPILNVVTPFDGKLGFLVGLFTDTEIRHIVPGYKIINGQMFVQFGLRIGDEFELDPLGQIGLVPETKAVPVQIF